MISAAARADLAALPLRARLSFFDFRVCKGVTERCGTLFSVEAPLCAWPRRCWRRKLPARSHRAPCAHTCRTIHRLRFCISLFYDERLCRAKFGCTEAATTLQTRAPRAVLSLGPRRPILSSPGDPQRTSCEPIVANIFWSSLSLIFFYSLSAQAARTARLKTP